MLLSAFVLLRYHAFSVAEDAEASVDVKVKFCTHVVDHFNFGLVEVEQFDDNGHPTGVVLTKEDAENDPEVQLAWARYGQCVKYLTKDPWTRAEYLSFATSPAAALEFGDVGGAQRHLLLGSHHPVVLVPGKPNFNRFYLIPAYDFVVGSFVKHGGTYDQNEEQVLRMLLNPGNCVVEVGSNIGSYTVVLADEVGKDGLVYAFEPFRKIFQIMNANIALNGYGNVITKQVGLSNKKDFVSVRAPSLNDFTNLGAARVFFQQNEDISHVPFEGYEEIEVDTLDNLRINCGQTHQAEEKKVDFLKIDAEGMELEVIQGGLGLIHSHQPLIYVESQPFFQNGDDRFVSKMREYGYVCSPIPNLEMHELLLCIPPSRYDSMAHLFALLHR